MAPKKRSYNGSTQPDVEPPSKGARLHSSQSTVPRSSQTYSPTQASTPPSSRPPGSSQFVDGGEEEPIDLTQTQEDEGSSLELYGSFDIKVVGVRYYNGIATPHELVICRREPHNPYDPNAIQVLNVVGQQIGHLPRKVAEKLTPYIDRDELVVEAILTGEKGFYDCPIRLYLYGTSDTRGRLELESKLKKEKLVSATQLKNTRKEAEARRNVLGLQSGTSSVGFGTAEEQVETSLKDLVNASKATQAVRTDGLADQLAMGEDALQKLPMAEQPGALRSQLLPYQLQGLAWMLAKESPQIPAVGSDHVAQLWKRENNTRFRNLASGFITASPPKLFSGGILADDMGLGKTLQIISLILAGESDKSKAGTLIVAPVSVLGNWEQQIKYHVKEEHAPRILAYHSCKTTTAAELRQYDIVVTSYGMISTEFKAKNKRILGVDWRRVVLDEGHTIRNPKSRTSKAVRSLKAKSRWVLTGTPIINSVRDFLSLLQFLKISGGLEDEGLFSQVITRPIKQRGNGDPDRVRAGNLLGHLMKDICLRRRKDMKFIDLKLSPKTEYAHRITFTKAEKTKYDALLAEAQGELEKYQTNSKFGQKGRYANILERLLRLRQICNHWTLCKERVQDLLALFEDQKVVALDDKNTPILQQALQLMIDSQEECAICYEEIGLHEPVITACKHIFGKPCISKAIEMQHKCPMCRHGLTPESLVDPAPETQDDTEQLDDASQSSKTEALIKILQATLKNEGSKVVVFSQWTSFLNIVQSRLQEVGMTYTRIDGGMPKKARDAAIDALNDDPNTRIMLASLQVCSVGLNLVAADTVILSDSWWAPAIEDQAVDRVHRLGQTRPTTIWRLIVEGTVEERVVDIQAEKRLLVSEAFHEKQAGKAKETRLADITKLLS